MTPGPPALRQVEAEIAAELAAVRPGLAAAYAAALPDARAAVLGRLWRGLLYEPLPGVAEQGPGRVRLHDGRLLTGPARLPHDLDPAPRPEDRPGAGTPRPGTADRRATEAGGGMAVRVDGRAYADPADLLAALGLPGSARLAADLERSTASLALSRAGASTRDVGREAGWEAGWKLEAFEQGVVDGHPYHPCCRNRPGFSVAEQLAYAPEHRPVVRLDLVDVPASRCLVAGPWPAELTDGDRVLVPVHPWQSRHRLPELGLEPSAAGVIPARPLMSLRTLAPVDGGPHVKTAVSARMTSHVRDISAASVRDAVPLSDLLTRAAARLGRAAPHIARYLCGAAVRVDGVPSAEVAVLLREPPSRFAGPEEVVAPLAALTTRPASGGPPLVRVLAEAAGGTTGSTTGTTGTTGSTAGSSAGWLAAFARTAFTAGLGLLAMGIALEAHGQNLLAVLDRHGRPARVVYRDLADIRVSPARLGRHGLETPPLHPRLVTDDPRHLREKLFGSLVGTTFAGLVSALGHGDRAVEARLWDVVATAARRAFDELPATDGLRADRAALFGPELPVKAHTLMQIDGGPPGDRWAYLPNPLAGG
ncbi:DNA polymerase-3 subunit chi [Nonomuraea muscovyensis]|uniref:DNA polymerase-3 subunit chi n=1 Tax=Nonomuraea muscovyensis TaxID=1124761 RepID=A0A7X0C5P7_9ACTN|nr:IucA/IucC family protein [Nonomuraea muscovyensis]MBB6349018.1 DNA polymerase-3 subunit chi [Nonomuraea muscovyensis]